MTQNTRLMLGALVPGFRVLGFGAYRTDLMGCNGPEGLNKCCSSWRMLLGAWLRFLKLQIGCRGARGGAAAVAVNKHQVCVCTRWSADAAHDGANTYLVLELWVLGFGPLGSTFWVLGLDIQGSDL
jgi:hypothetical protein